MKVKFDVVEGELPYKAEYIEYQTPPTHIRLGMGGAVGHSAGTYERLLEEVVKDLRGCPEYIEPIFSGAIDPDLQGVTTVALKILHRYNTLEKKLGKVKSELTNVESTDFL